MLNSGIPTQGLPYLQLLLGQAPQNKSWLGEALSQAKFSVPRAFM